MAWTVDDSYKVDIGLVGGYSVTIWVGVRAPYGYDVGPYGEGALVYVDGSKVGETNSNSEVGVTVSEGEHTFRAEDPLESCYPASKTLTITSDTRVELVMEPKV